MVTPRNPGSEWVLGTVVDSRPRCPTLGGSDSVVLSQGRETGE